MEFKTYLQARRGGQVGKCPDHEAVGGGGKWGQKSAVQSTRNITAISTIQALYNIVTAQLTLRLRNVLVSVMLSLMNKRLSSLSFGKCHCCKIYF